MKKLFSFLTLSMIVIESLYAQTIFSVIHLNDKEDVQHGYAESIEWKLIDLQAGERGVKKGILRMNHKNQVITDFENNIYTSITKSNSITVLVESYMFDKQSEEGTSLETEKFIYDTNNVLTEIIHFDNKMQIFQNTLIKNNEKGFPVELATYNTDGTLAGNIEKAEYLFQDNMYISNIYSPDGVLLSSNNEILNFNTNHRYKNPDLEYNESGDLIKSCISDKGYYFYSYKYDNLSNWIEYRVYKVKISKKGKEKKLLKTIYNRHIEYW
jgi:hypothetical protein